LDRESAWRRSVPPALIQYAIVTRPPGFRSESFAEAKKDAEATGVWLIVDAAAEWCAPCKQMDAGTWRDTGVVRWLEDHAIAVQVDVDAESELAKQLEIRSMPTIIAFKGGEEKDRIVGYRDPKGLLVWLEGLARGETDLDQVRKSVVDPTSDMRGRLALARTLLRTGRREEATEELVWLWQNIARVEPAMSGVRVSYLARDIKTLIQSHAPARARFLQIREELDDLLNAGATASRFDWIVLNEMLGAQEQTLAWFDAVKNDPGSAGTIDHCAHRLIDLLVERERWVDIGRLYRDPVAVLTRDHGMTTPPMGASVPTEMLASLREMMARRFRQRAALLLRCLRAAGRGTEAEALEAEALRLDSTHEMMKALVDASAPAPATGEPPPATSSATKTGTNGSGSRPGLLARPTEEQAQGQRAEESLAAVRHAVALNRKLAVASPEFARALASTLWKLNHLLRDPNERAEGLAVATEAVALCRRLAVNDDSSQALEGLAISLHNLGIRHGQAQNLSEALESATEAVGLYSKLSGREPAYRNPLAIALVSLGGHQNALGLSQEALETSSRAVAIYREMGAADETVLPGLAGALINLAVHQNALGLKEAALQTGLEATAFRRKLAAQNPDESSRSALASALTNLEAYQGGLGLRKEAMATAIESVALHRSLAASAPEAYLSNLATGLLNLGVSQNRLGLRQDAHDSTAEAVALFRQLDAATPGAFAANLARSLVNLGVFQGAIGMLQEALDSTEEAVRIRRPLAACNPGSFLSLLGMSLNNLASRRTKLGWHDEALEAALEAVSVLRAGAAEKPSAFRSHLGNGLGTLGEVQSNLGQLSAAVGALSEAATIRRELARGLPSAYEPDLAKTLSQLGKAHCDAGAAAEAVATITEALAIQRKLALADEGAFVPDLAISLANLGVSQLAAGSPGEALAAATEAVTLHRQLAGARPESFQSDLAKSLYYLATIHRACDRHDEALAAAREAAKIYAPLADRFPRAFSKPLQDVQAVARTALERLGLPAAHLK
jgi:thiol-disulfide isomerase/thioredoxin